MVHNYRALSSSKIIRLCKKILGEKKNSINLTDISIRLDPPNDRRNALDWHQDSSYFRQNKNCFDSLVLWVPLIDLDNKTGGVDILKNSFRLGALKSKRKKVSNKYFSEKRSIDGSMLREFRSIKFDNLKKGDAIIMNMNMIHKSGDNISDKFRITLIGRYHRTLTKSFNSGLNVYKYSNKILNKEVHGF